MFKIKNYFLSLVIVFTIFCGQTEGYYPGVWNIGDVGTYIYQKVSTREECTQTCWKKLAAGEFYVGVQRRIPSFDCYCMTTSMGMTPTGNTNWEFLPFFYGMASPQVFNSEIGSFLNFNIKIKFFSGGNSSSSVFFIDNIDNPTSYSKRMLIKNYIYSVNPIRTSYASRISTRNNDSRTVNSLLETFVGNGVEKEFENSYTIITKVGDDSVESNHTQWVALVLTTSKSISVRLTSFRILRPAKNCSLVSSSSSNVTNYIFYLNFQLKPDTQCVVDLESVAIYLYYNSKLVFNNILRDDSSMAPTVIQKEPYIVIYLPKLYIDSMLKFSLLYDTNVTNARVGNEILAVKADIFSNEFLNNAPKLALKKFVFQKSFEKLQSKDITSIYPVWSYNNENGTMLDAVLYQYVCKAVLLRQQSSCYQREKSSGRIKFLPIQFYDIIGYSNKTRLIYGYTNRNNVVELDFNRKPVLLVLSNDKWENIKADRFVASTQSM